MGRDEQEAYITAEELLEELHSYATPEFDPETEITARMFAERYGMKPQKAKAILDAEVKRGAMVGRTTTRNGRQVIAYSKARIK